MEPLFTNDAIVFGILMSALGLVFYTSNSDHPGLKKFYTVFPPLLLCYMVPAIFTTAGWISPHWEYTDSEGNVLQGHSELYNMAKNYLLPAALVLMTLSIDLKSVFSLGPKSLIMFFTGTIGIIIGGPLAILAFSTFAPEIVGGAGPDAVWRGLATLAGSWIGGGANQTAMLEIYGYNQANYAPMVIVDIVVANIWMAILLFGIGKKDQIDRWLKADSSAITRLQEKVEQFQNAITQNPKLKDLMVVLGVAFGITGLSHVLADGVTHQIATEWTSLQNSVVDSRFFWLVVMATTLGIGMSFTKARNLEGYGASKLGSVFIYILVATIGMKMDLATLLDPENAGLIGVGIVWMFIHVMLLIAVAKIIRAPYFFLAVGSKANVGGAASAPVVAAAFHPSLAPVGVLLAVLGYALGTYGAIFCATLMEMVAP